MRILKKIFLALIFIVVVSLLAALVMPKDYSVKREITVNKPVDSVYNYVRFLKNQNDFNVWSKIDPKMKQSYSGIDGEVGSISSWESQNEQVGIGEQEIVKLTTNQRIDFELRFKKPMEDTATGFMTTESIAPNQTKVTWGIEGRMPYPTNLMLPFIKMDELIGKDLSQGLENMKDKLEK